MCWAKGATVELEKTAYYIALGSNIGDREAYIRSAIKEIGKEASIIVEDTSSLYETPPWGMVDQGAFLNAVCRIATTLEPETLLLRLQAVENKLGRERHIHWGPRTIDLDIICYAHEPERKFQSPSLTLPHPYFWERAFVLEPLSEIAPSFCYESVQIQERLAMLDISDIKKLP